MPGDLQQLVGRDVVDHKEAEIRLVYDGVHRVGFGLRAGDIAFLGQRHSAHIVPACLDIAGIYRLGRQPPGLFRARCIGRGRNRAPT